MEPLKLSKDDVRVRRRIMHHITRGLTDPNQKAAFEKHFKDAVHHAITVVLATERMAAERLVEHLSKET